MNVLFSQTLKSLQFDDLLKWLHANFTVEIRVDMITEVMNYISNKIWYSELSYILIVS